MSHKTFQLQLSAFVDGELSGPEVDELRQHLSSCAECQRSIAEYKLIRLDLRTAASIELTGNFASTVARAARIQAEPQYIWGGAELFARRLVIGLTMIVFFVVSVSSLNSSEPEVIIEPGFSGLSSDSTAQKTLLQGEVSKEDMILAVVER